MLQRCDKDSTEPLDVLQICTVLIVNEDMVHFNAHPCDFTPKMDDLEDDVPFQG